MNEKIDRNFRMIRVRDSSGKNKTVPLLRARFDSLMFSDGKYIEKYQLDKTMFSKLMNRRVTGKNVKDENSTVGKIIAQLKKDGVWAGELPWIKKEEKEES